MIRVAVFDFDGTIADSFDLFVESFRKIAPPGADQGVLASELQGLSIKEILGQLKIKKWQIPKLVVKGRKEMAKGVSRLEAFKGLPKELAKIKDQGTSIYILSSNSKDSIQSFLLRNRLDHLVDEVVGGVSLFGKSKAIKKLAKSHAHPLKDVVYIGDEVRDISASKKAGVRSIAVTWGFNNKNILEKNGATYIAKTPEELGNIIANQS